MTATIIPNAIRTAHVDASQRRAEYLAAIELYSQYAEVYFLENSTYDLASDPAFHQHANVHIRKFPPSVAHDKGKGYQEFEMLDNWLNAEQCPPSRWIKVTGRHLARNFDKIFAECLTENQHELIIEQTRAPCRVALTELFYITTEYYQRRFQGIYRECDDDAHIFIEHIVRNHIRASDKFRLFHAMPLMTGVRGTSGEVFGITLQRRLRRLIGKCLYPLNEKYRFL
ncbi:MAG: hypothetical protein PHQ73_04560 [Gallionella sp.]|nr:hypothetical protein [Gallionella sp.]